MISNSGEHLVYVVTLVQGDPDDMVVGVFDNEENILPGIESYPLFSFEDSEDAPYISDGFIRDSAQEPIAYITRCVVQ